MTLGNFGPGSLQRIATVGENISSQQTLDHSGFVRRFPKSPECCPADSPLRGASVFVTGFLTRPRKPL
jgi:hypothetical protein